MTVVLFLLKLVGIVLLVLVGLVLLLSLALLLVPVRYRIRGEAAQELTACSARICVSWLFHLIHFQLVLEKKELESSLRICGIPIGLGGEAEEGADAPGRRKKKKKRKTERKKKRNRRQRREKRVPAEESQSQRSAEEPQEKASAEESQSQRSAEESQGERSAAELQERRLSEVQTTGSETPEAERSAAEQTVEENGTKAVAERNQSEAFHPSADKTQDASRGAGKTKRGESGTGTAKQEAGEAPSSSEQEAASASENKKKRRRDRPSFSDKIRRIFGMIRKKWETLKEMVRRIGRRLHALWEQAGSVKAFLSRIREEIHREENRRALKAVLREIKYLIRHMGPKKISMQLTFGTIDPALTGKLVGLISTLPFFYRSQVQVIPDFSSEFFYLKGPFEIKGHARGVHAVLSALRLILDKNIRGILQRYRNS